MLKKYQTEILLWLVDITAITLIFSIWNYQKFNKYIPSPYAKNKIHTRIKDYGGSMNKKIL